MFCMQLLLSCALALAAQSARAGVPDGPGPEFLENILQFFGQNDSISTRNLENLLLLVSARRSELISEENPLEDQEVCLVVPGGGGGGHQSRMITASTTSVDQKTFL